MNQSTGPAEVRGFRKFQRGGLRRPGAWISLALAFTVMIGGIFWPVLGLAVPLLLIAAILGSFRKKRWFCQKACPRGKILSHLVAPWSRYRTMPEAFRSDGVRMAGCGFLMVCAVGQTMRLWPDFQTLGWFFWVVCVTTFIMAMILGLVFKPRSWCSVCPLATLQSALTSPKREV